jgi:hypothetical protein
MSARTVEAATRTEVRLQVVQGATLGEQSLLDTSQMTPIDVLPDNVLLELLGFCLDGDQDTMTRIEELQSLVHVCQRWRSVVFGSPRRFYFYLIHPIFWRHRIRPS